MSLSGTNNKLKKAKENKNDEFYTRYEDIEKYMTQFQEHLKYKVVYCNCDDPSFSNFYKFFKINFTKLGLKRLISTYKSDEPYRYDYDGINETKIPIESGLFEYNSDIINEFKDDIIVVTNPPFSLIRNYIEFLMNFEVKFIIIAPITIISLNQTFKYFKENKIYPLLNTRFCYFITPDNQIKEVVNTTFFGNIEINKPNYKLTKTYNENNYQKYVNSDCLFIDKTENIPYDYKGLMAVPISSIYLLNKNQFDIIDMTNSSNQIINQIPIQGNQFKIQNNISNTKTPSNILDKGYCIVLPKNKTPKSVYYIIEDNNEFKDKKIIVPFARIIIKLKSI